MYCYLNDRIIYITLFFCVLNYIFKSQNATMSKSCHDDDILIPEIAWIYKMPKNNYKFQI